MCIRRAMHSMWCAGGAFTSSGHTVTPRAMRDKLWLPLCYWSHCHWWYLIIMWLHLRTNHRHSDAVPCVCVCVCVCVTRCVCVNAERFAGMAFPDRNSPIKRQTLVVWITVDSLNLGISLRTVEENKTETKLTSIQHKINRNCWCLSCGREKLFCVRLAEEISFFNCAVFCDFYRKFHFKYLYFYSDRQF